MEPRVYALRDIRQPSTGPPLDREGLVAM
jgi:hypothetical protein